MNAGGSIVLLLVAVGWVEGSIAATIADYRNDYATATFPPCWVYQWNAGGAIGNTNSFSDLMWSADAGVWNVDGGSPFPRPVGYYVNVNSMGGHPGPGPAEGAPVDRYVIAGYTLPVSTTLFVTGSLLRVTDLSGQVDLRLYVNNIPVRTLTTIQGNTNFETRFDGWLGNWSAGDIVYVTVGPSSSHNFDGFLLDYSLSDKPQPAHRTAVEGDSFTNQFRTVAPRQGWNYLWNSDGPIGNPRNYSPLQWNGTRYERDTDSTFPDETPAMWVTLFGPNGGHPGQGTGHGAPYDVYAVASLCVPVDGRYVLTNAWVNNTDAGSVSLIVHVNTNAPVVFLNGLTSVSSPHRFGTDLGLLNAGDTVYIGVGPDGDENNDSFVWDFTILLRGGRSTLMIIR